MTRELLSEVLGINVSDIYTNKRLVTYSHEGINFDGTPFSKDENINIYELAHKCKEWAWREKRVYEIVERKTQVDVYKNGKRVAQFIGDSLTVFLPTRVFEAAEYILKETK